MVVVVGTHIANWTHAVKQPIEPMQWTSPIYLNGGGNIVLSAKRSPPRSQLTHTVKHSQFIYMVIVGTHTANWPMQWKHSQFIYMVALEIHAVNWGYTVNAWKYLNGGADSVLSAKRLPTQLI